MKKFYVLLAATHILTTACMEQERNWSYDESATAYPLVVFNSTKPKPQQIQTLLNPAISNNPLPCNPTIDTNWPKYNEIMNGTYNRNQPSTLVTHPDKLAPIYKERMTLTKKSIERKEKKSLLRTIIPKLPANTDLMQKIYTDAFEIIYTLQNNKKNNWIVHNRNLAVLIHSMNNAREVGINADTMGQFSYTKQPVGFISQIIGGTEYHGTEECTTLLFSCLKRYTSTIKKNAEPLPDIETKNQSFAQIFDISPNKHEIYNLHYYSVATSSSFKKYPAFVYLEYVVRNLVQIGDHKTVKHLTSCFYAEKPTKPNSSLKNSYVDLKNEFYAKAYDLLLNNGSSEQVYEIVEIIDTAKRLKDINHENELGYGILGFEPTIKITINFYEYFNNNYPTIITKNRIALLCTLIEKYNNARLEKITPTSAQHQAYALYKDLNLVRPDDCRCIQLNKRHYAFAEFKQLIEDIRGLMTADDHNVAQEGARLYPPKK